MTQPIDYRSTTTSEALFKTNERGRGDRAIYELRFDVKIGDYIVPQHFRTDRISQPWFVRAIMPRKVRDRMDWAAILHDYLRARRFDIPTWKTDLIFLSVMCETGVPVLWRNAAYLAVQTNNNRA